MPESSFTTPDQERIRAHWRPAENEPGQRLVVVAPGYAQNHRTRSMQALAEYLSRLADVLVVSFRGTGGSTGRFTFGAKDYLDLAGVLGDWPGKQYREIHLLGFSLGTYTALRLVLEGQTNLSGLYLVSPFGWPAEIMLSWSYPLHPLYRLLRRTRFKIKPQQHVWFRWGNLATPKPDLAARPLPLTAPVHFLVGGQDSLVLPRMSKRLYEAVSSEKTWTLDPEGLHAEHMFLQNPDGFIGWLREHLGEKKPG